MSEVRSPTLADVIDHGIQSALGDVRVCLPGRVKSYDAVHQSAHVQPILRQTYVDENDDEQSVAFPVIPNVPVVFPGAGGFRITFPLGAGDDVLLVFSDYGLDKYLSNGGASVDPVALHQHQLSDAIAIPGLHPFNSPWAGAGSPNMTMGSDSGPQIHLTGSGINLGASSAHEAFVMGTTYRAAEDLFVAAVGVLVGALSTYAAAIQPTADSAGTVTTTLATACTTLGTALTVFKGAGSTYLSTVVKGT